MGELRMTTRRRELLDAIANGQVLTEPEGIGDVEHERILLFPWAPTQWQDSVTVTARVRELETAGWAEQHRLVKWRLTATGEQARIPKVGTEQLAGRLGLQWFQLERALADGLIPPMDTAQGWLPATVDALAARAAEIRAATGSLPDVGVNRAADELSRRFGVVVDWGAVLELSKMGIVPVVGEYKDHDLYCGRALERLDRAVLDRAREVGQLLLADQAAKYLKIRRTDFDHLIRAAVLTAATFVRSSWQRKRDTPEVPLYRRGDLDTLAADPGIDWAAVRATKPGQRSPLAGLFRAAGDAGG